MNKQTSYILLGACAYTAILNIVALNIPYYFLSFNNSISYYYLTYSQLYSNTRTYDSKCTTNNDRSIINLECSLELSLLKLRIGFIVQLVSSLVCLLLALFASHYDKVAKIKLVQVGMCVAGLVMTIISFFLLFSFLIKVWSNGIDMITFIDNIIDDYYMYNFFATVSHIILIILYLIKFTAQFAIWGGSLLQAFRTQTQENIGIGCLPKYIANYNLNP